MENYNFLVERADDRLPLNHALPQLAPDGTWETAPPADLDGEWVDIRNVWESEWSPLSFMVDEQGFATGFTVTWSPQASPYTGRLRLDDAMLEYLPDLLLALSPSGEGWHFPWQSEWFQRRWVNGGGVQSAFSRSRYGLYPAGGPGVVGRRARRLRHPGGGGEPGLSGVGH